MICAFFFYCKRRSKRAKDSLANLSTPHDIGGFVNAVLVQEIPRTTVSTAQSSRSGDGDKDAGGLWRDEVILGARVPREKVAVKRLISRGGYGEVYIGIYNRQRVAVKMLLPETRKCREHRDSFLAEVKLMAALDHPQIVRLIGVAWNSPNDLCSLTEYIAGGDLRAIINKYQKENRATGFTLEKVKIALHVAHAPTYLHSLDPPVIHRDLKSKNILLTLELDAKLTDFLESLENASIAR